MFARTIDVGSVEWEVLSGQLMKALYAVQARDVRLEGNRIVFEGGLFRMVSNWNVLVAITSGVLEFDRATNSLRYRVTFTQLLVVLVLLAAFGLLVATSGRVTRAPLVPVLVVVWGWLGLGNVIIAIVRFEGFLRQAIDDARGASA